MKPLQELVLEAKTELSKFQYRGGYMETYYGVIHRDDFHDRILGKACFQKLYLEPVSGAKLLYYWTPRLSPTPRLKSYGFVGADISSETRNRWIRYVMIVSPWSRAFAGVNDDLDFASKYGVVITDMTLPANYVIGALAALRMMCEYPDEVNLWDHMVGNGVHPDVACVFGAAIKNGYWYSQSKGHEALATYNFTVPTIQNFLNGKFIQLLQAFGVNTTFTPMTSLWGTSASFDQIKDPYSKQFSGRKTIHEWTEIALQEQRELL